MNKFIILKGINNEEISTIVSDDSNNSSLTMANVYNLLYKDQLYISLYIKLVPNYQEE